MRGLIAILIGLLGAAPWAVFGEMEVFIVDGKVTSIPGVQVYHLTAGDAVLNVVNTQLKKDGVTTEVVGRGYVNQQLEDALVNQVSGLAKAANYRLQYFPAVVIDGEYVVYGTSDVEVAEQLRPAQ